MVLMKPIALVGHVVFRANMPGVLETRSRKRKTLEPSNSGTLQPRRTLEDEEEDPKNFGTLELYSRTVELGLCLPGRRL